MSLVNKGEFRMKNEKIGMGSSIIDLYMEGFDEGKNDVCEAVEQKARGNKKFTEKTTSFRRKKSYHKSQKRMRQLSSVAHYTPDVNNEHVVRGMLRSHQLPISATVRYENPCGVSIGNKRRLDAVNRQIRELN
jgi:hypothetical protein